MTPVKISILIPVYNAEKTIERCIQSISAQTFHNFEIIAVNDGSKDRSEEILHELAEQEGRLLVFSQINKGVSAARNEALNHAYGEYVMFVDCDDYLKPDYLKTYYDAIAQSGSDLVIGGCTQISLLNYEVKEIIPPKTGDITEDVWKYLSMNIRCFGFVCSKIIRRALIEENHIRFDEKMYSQEDLNFYLDVYKYADRITAIDNTGYVYEYAPSERKPDTIGYINNQLKLLEICRFKNTLNSEIEKNIENRLKSYVFGCLLNSDDIRSSLKQLCAVEGLAQVLKRTGIRNEKDLIGRLFAGSHDRMILAWFGMRRWIRKLVRRG